MKIFPVLLLVSSFGGSYALCFCSDVKFIRPADVLSAKHLEEKEVFPYEIPMDMLPGAVSGNDGWHSSLGATGHLYHSSVEVLAVLGVASHAQLLVRRWRTWMSGFWRVSNILNYVTVLPRGLQYSQCCFNGDKIEISNFNTSLIAPCCRLRFNIARKEFTSCPSAEGSPSEVPELFVPLQCFVPFAHAVVERWEL